MYGAELLTAVTVNVPLYPKGSIPVTVIRSPTEIFGEVDPKDIVAVVPLPVAPELAVRRLLPGVKWVVRLDGLPVGDTSSL